MNSLDAIMFELAKAELTPTQLLEKEIREYRLMKRTAKRRNEGFDGGVRSLFNERDADRKRMSITIQWLGTGRSYLATDQLRARISQALETYKLEVQ